MICIESYESLACSQQQGWSVHCRDQISWLVKKGKLDNKKSPQWVQCVSFCPIGVSTECKASSSLTCLSQKCPFPQLLILARGCWMELASHPPPHHQHHHPLRTVCALSSRDRHTFRYTHTTPKNPQTTAVHSGRWILLQKTDDNVHAYLRLKNLITGSMQPCPTNLVNMSLRSKKTTSNNITNYSLCQSITRI